MSEVRWCHACGEVSWVEEDCDGCLKCLAEGNTLRTASELKGALTAIEDAEEDAA